MTDEGLLAAKNCGIRGVSLDDRPTVEMHVSSALVVSGIGMRLVLSDDNIIARVLEIQERIPGRDVAMYHSCVLH